MWTWVSAGRDASRGPAGAGPRLAAADSRLSRGERPRAGVSCLVGRGDEHVRRHLGRQRRPSRLTEPSTSRASIVAPGRTPWSARIAQQLGVLLQLLADPPDDDRPSLGGGRRGQQRQRVQHRGGLPAERLAPRAGRPGRGSGCRTGRPTGLPSRVEQLALHRLAHDVLPAAGLLVDVGVVQADDVDEQALGEPVLAHDGRRQLPALVGQLQVPVALDGEQAVALHAGHGLADRGAALVEPFRDARPQRDDPLFLQLEDRPEVHLGRVDEVVHRYSSVSPASLRAAGAWPARPSDPVR